MAKKQFTALIYDQNRKKKKNKSMKDLRLKKACRIYRKARGKKGNKKAKTSAFAATSEKKKKKKKKERKKKATNYVMTKTNERAKTNKRGDQVGAGELGNEMTTNNCRTKKIQF